MGYTINNFFFFHRLGWFPIQGLRPTCYCISGPSRRIPAVGVTRHTPWAHCRTWVYPYQGNASHHTTMDPASLSPPATHAHGARPLDVNLRVVRFPAPRTPHTQTAPVSRPDTKNQRSPGALQEHNDAPAIHLQCVKGDTDVKSSGVVEPERSTSATTPMRSSTMLVASYGIHGWKWRILIHPDQQF